jgi:trigger factor
MNVRIEPIADQHGFLHISIGPEDYAPKLNSELKRIKKSAHIKGFRQGAVPDAMVQKLYGEDIKADLLNKLLNQTITDYQKNNGVNFIGDLIEIPNEDQAMNNDSLEFRFEVGIAPKPEISSIVSGLDIVKYKVIIPEERIDEEVEHLRNRMGESLETEDEIIKDDLVEVEALELAGDMIKEGGWKTSFPVSIGEYSHENFMKATSGLRKSDKFKFNIREVENNLSDKDIAKYLLKTPEGDEGFEMPGDHYEGTITKVLRKQKAELNEGFYKKAFGPDTTIANEIELRQNLRDNLQTYFDKECDKLFDIELVKKLVKQSALKYPDQFLIKWLKATYEEWQHKEGHDLEHELYHFKEGLSWKILREKILDEQEFKITYEDVSGLVIAEIKNQYPAIQLPDESWQELAKRTMSDKEKSMHYFVEAQNQKVLNWLKSQINIVEQEISLDEFRDKVKQINEHHHH